MDAARDGAGRPVEYTSRQQCAVSIAAAGQRPLGQLIVISLGSRVLSNFVHTLFRANLVIGVAVTPFGRRKNKKSTNTRSRTLKSFSVKMSDLSRRDIDQKTIGLQPYGAAEAKREQASPAASDGPRVVRRRLAPVVDDAWARGETSGEVVIAACD